MRYACCMVYAAFLLTSGIHAFVNETMEYNYDDTYSTNTDYRNVNAILEESQNSTSHLRRRLSQKGYNILALGGSVTWGSQLEDRSKAFPNLIAELGPHKVRNRALRATGSFYPAVCLQSMMVGDDTNYDIIILEFTINGVRAFDWLVKRLRARYPNAIIIYVHLYSLRFNIIDDFGKTPYDHGIYGDFRSHTERKWYYKPPGSRQKVPPQVRDIPKEWGMYSYYLPFPKFPADAEQWFSEDWHHLSQKGHEKVAKEILDLITVIDMNDPLKPPVEGSWGLGDKCHNWFGSGKTDLTVVKGEMRQMQRFGVFQGKYTIEFNGGETGGLMFTNTQQRAPMWVHYMSTGKVYPKATVQVWDNSFVVDHEMNKDIIGEKVETKQIGWAETADNFITFTPEFGFQEPFRLAAIGYCGACYEDVIGQPKVRHEPQKDDQ